MNQINYQKELDQLLTTEDLSGKKLLLHSCCAPCSSYVLEYLHSFFQIELFYYNPNISETAEYERRVEEQKRLIAEMGFDVTFREGSYEPERFFALAKGFETDREGGERCFRCYELRLREAAEAAKLYHCDYFATTLTISPLKNAEKLNELGRKIEAETGVAFLPSDFKKKNGYKRSIELSKEHHLYRQEYCGCIYSKLAREKEIKEKK